MASGLSDRQINEFRTRLKQRFFDLRREISEALLRSDTERYVDLAGQVADVEERSVADLLVDVGLAELDRDIGEIRDIDAALIRIAIGGYGECIRCGEPIGIERLNAYPTAKRCIDCQRLHEKTYAHPGRSSL